MVNVICNVCSKALDLYKDKYYKGYYCPSDSTKNEKFGETNNIIVVCMSCAGVSND